jgi:hypothetical protein
MNNTVQQNLAQYGFAEIAVEDGMTKGEAYTKSCSGERSDCCTRTCKIEENFVGSAEEWEQFLDIEGGQVQY